MFSAEFRSLILQVLTSWQVIAVTVVVIFYIFIVRYVARLYNKRPRKAAPLPKKKAEKVKEKDPVLADSDDLELDDHVEEKAK